MDLVNVEVSFELPQNRGNSLDFTHQLCHLAVLLRLYPRGGAVLQVFFDAFLHFLTLFDENFERTGDSNRI